VIYPITVCICCFRAKTQKADTDLLKQLKRFTAFIGYLLAEIKWCISVLFQCVANKQRQFNDL